MKRGGNAAGVLAVTLWGFWSAAPRVWCSAPDGHGAVESLFSACCRDSTPACPPSGDVSAAHQGAEAPGDHPAPGRSTVPSGDAGCTDTLLPSALSRPDRGPILPPPACDAGFGIGGGTPSIAVRAGGTGLLRHLGDLSPPSCRGFQTSLRI